MNNLIFHNRPSYLYSLDFLRGLAALSILVYHYSVLSKQTQGGFPPLNFLLSPIYEFGSLAVIFFWVISGFVFSLVYFEKFVDWKQFFWARFIRLYPLHFLTLCVVAILQIVSWNSVGQFQIYESNDLKHFIYNLLFISGWGYFGADSFNAPIWSVSAEIFSYAAFFFLLPSMRKFKFAVPAILICLFYLLMYLHFPLMNLWTCAFYFFSGCFLYSIYSKYQSNVLIFLTLLVLSFFSLYLELLKIFYVLIFSSIVILFSQFEEKTTFFKKNKLIGDITYGVYLWHIPFHILTLLIFMHLKIDFIWFQNTIFFICFNILIILFSIFSFKYIEDPIRRKYRNSIF